MDVMELNVMKTNLSQMIYVVTLIEVDNELYYSSDDEYDSASDWISNSDQYVNINLYCNAYS